MSHLKRSPLKIRSFAENNQLIRSTLVVTSGPGMLACWLSVLKICMVLESFWYDFAVAVAASLFCIDLDVT
jgi:hypothetical protein